jgi:hypothetical protein
MKDFTRSKIDEYREICTKIMIECTKILLIIEK